MPSHPKGPDLETIKYTTKPTTTGGKPIIVLNKIRTLFLPQKFFIAKSVPRGKPNKQESKSDIPLTLKDRISISNKLSSIVITNSIALFKASKMIFILIFILIFYVLICNIMFILHKLQFVITIRF